MKERTGGAAARPPVDPETAVMPTPRSAKEPITTADEELAGLAKALAHPARVAILRQLAEEGACVCGRIVSALPLAQATVSQHLKVLKDAGFVQGEIDGPRVCYCLEPKTLRRLRKLVNDLPTREE